MREELGEGEEDEEEDDERHDDDVVADAGAYLEPTARVPDHEEEMTGHEI